MIGRAAKDPSRVPRLVARVAQCTFEPLRLHPVLWQDRAVRGRWLGLGALMAAVVAAVPACDDATPVQRGFGSRQLVPTRDPTFAYYGATGDVIFYHTGLYGDGAGQETYWSIDLGTGEMRNLGSTMPSLTDPPPTPRFQCGYEVDHNTLTGNFIIADTQSDMKTVIDRVVWTDPYCVEEGDPMLTVWRKEEDGTKTRWIGPYDDLKQTPLSVRVREVFWHADDATLVEAARPETPDQLGVFAIPDQDPTNANEIVPAGLGDAAWADGAAPSTDLLSSTLACPTFFFAAPEQRYCYERVMGNGSEVMFIGPYATGAVRERGLFAVPPGDSLRPLSIQPYSYRYDGLWGTGNAWSSVEGDPPGVVFRIWDDADARLATCPWPLEQAPRALADPTGENALFLRQTSTSGPGPFSALLLMVPNAADGNPCKQLADEWVGYADFSPDGTAMTWLVEKEIDKATLWTAGRDGSAARVIGTGYIRGAAYPNTQAPHFVGGSQLELTLDGDLVWIDVHDDPARTHYITEQVFGSPVDLGRWVVTGHDFSDQDSTGQLALINRDTGETRPISPAVYTYTSPDLRSYDITPGVFKDDGQPIRIVYQVRGRNPSPQDGIWIATITAQDRR
jgi:hypothetical protein